MSEPLPPNQTPEEFVEECRRLAKQATVFQSFELWPSRDRAPGELFRTRSFDEAVEYLDRKRMGVLVVVFEWEIAGKFGQSEVEFLHEKYPSATATFISQLTEALITARIAEILFKERYPGERSR